MDQDKILSLLSGLGDNSDAIALSLKEKGITGSCGSIASCPIARFLQKETDDNTVWAGGIHIGSGYHTFSTPGVVKSFMDRFDHGAFTYLREDR